MFGLCRAILMGLVNYLGSTQVLSFSSICDGFWQNHCHSLCDSYCSCIHDGRRGIAWEAFRFCRSRQLVMCFGKTITEVLAIACFLVDSWWSSVGYLESVQVLSFSASCGGFLQNRAQTSSHFVFLVH